MRQHPAVRGILEHHERATLFDAEAKAAPGPTAAFRHWMAAVYSLRAEIELMREAAKRGELTVSPARFDALIEATVPRYRLIRQLRIRDFHHCGVIGPKHMVIEFQIRLPALGRGDVHFRVNPSRPEMRLQLSDRSRNFRFFMTSGLLVQDHLEARPVSMRRLVGEQLQQLPRALKTFVQVLRA